MTSLSERIENATEPCRELDAETALLLGIVERRLKRGEWLYPDGSSNGLAPYTSSIDAAMTLVPAGYILQLSEWDHDDLRAKGAWQAILTQAGKRNSDMWGHRCDHAKTPALALCAAALRARGVE